MFLILGCYRIQCFLLYPEMLKTWRNKKKDLSGSHSAWSCEFGEGGGIILFLMEDMMKILPLINTIGFNFYNIGTVMHLKFQPMHVSSHIAPHRDERTTYARQSPGPTLSLYRVYLANSNKHMMRI